MKMSSFKYVGIATVLVAIGSETVEAQDQNAAAERARIANQRILAETEQRKREEEVSEEVEATSAAASTAAPVAAAAAPVSEPVATSSTAIASAPAAAAPATPPAVDTIAIDLSAVLEQIRALGELKDAGYVTEEEFERIKGRLLDGTL